MKKFIFITPEGYTAGPNDEQLENLQVLGIIHNAKSKEEALHKLLSENDWIIESDFQMDEIICHEII